MIKRMTLMTLAAVLVSLAVVSLGSAREVITINKANGGNYNVTAYNTSTRSYYYINGSLDSDSHKITVPNGYACTITVTKGRAVGDRNLYEERDPMSPIFEVIEKSNYVLELKYVGRSSSGVSVNSAPMVNGVMGGDDGQRKPPPGQ